MKSILSNVKIINKIKEYTENIKEDKLFDYKMSALKTLIEIKRPYDAYFLADNELLENCYLKKIEQLEMAKTKKEINNILSLSHIKINNINFTKDDYYLIEEELLMWSVASLTAPLNNEGYNRYLSVFKEYYGEELFKQVLI